MEQSENQTIQQPGSPSDKGGVSKKLKGLWTRWKGSLGWGGAVALLAAMFVAGKAGQILFLLVMALSVCGSGIAAVSSLVRILERREEATRSNVLSTIMKFMLFFFLFGVLVYFWAFLTIGETQGMLSNNFELILRSAICSLDMFMLDVDSNILDRLDIFPGLKGTIMVVSACAFSCTVGVLGSLVFSRARAYFNLRRRAKISEERDHLYVFFGMNEASRLLAADIRRNDPRGLTVFVERNNIGNEDDNDSLGGMVNLLTHRKKSFDTADETGAFIAIASDSFSDIPEGKIASHGGDLFGMVGLEKLRQLIGDVGAMGERYRTGGPTEKATLKLFFLSDNEESNIRNIIALAKDRTIRNLPPDDDRFDTQVYCHARVNGPNRVIEDLALREHIKVNLLDSSRMAVELIKADEEVQPVKVMKLSDRTPGAVVDPMEALIIGFGEVGRDAFRFLYEFGTFVGEGSDTRAEVAALPHITAIDRRMNTLRGDFIASMPAVDFFGDRIKLLQVDINERRFFNSILAPERCRTINYIVIATGDDETNISLAVSIFNHIRRYRDDMGNLLIMVRSLSDDKLEMMHRTADFYNQGYGDGKRNRPVIRFFGTPSYIYTYNLIVDDRLSTLTKQYYESYVEVNGEGKTWKEREELATVGDVGKGKLFETPQLDSLQNLRRKESQDRSNALHAATKVEFIRRALGGDEGVAELKTRLFRKEGGKVTSVRTGNGPSIRYAGFSDEENLLMLNLARLEHLRWNASHELMGYVPTDTHSSDVRTKIHNCLRAWNDLDAESSLSGYDYKGFDFVVVETTIKQFENSKQTKGENYGE